MPRDTPQIDPGNGADTPSIESGNGKLRLLTLNSLDGRTAASRRARDLIAEIESDLGGSDCLSAGQRQLVQRAAVLGALIESYEATWLAGKKTPIETYLSTINAQRRVLTTLGLERRAHDVTPSVGAYLGHVKAKDVAE